MDYANVPAGQNKLLSSSMETLYSSKGITITAASTAPTVNLKITLPPTNPIITAATLSLTDSQGATCLMIAKGTVSSSGTTITVTFIILKMDIQIQNKNIQHSA